MESSAAAMRSNFRLMSIWFGLGHGVLTAATAFASSQLDADVSYVGNGLLNFLTIPTCLLAAVPVTVYAGVKGSLLIGIVCYAFYSIGFSIAVMSAKGSALQWYSFCIGGVFGGVGAGVLWTAQGAFMANSASAISKEDEQPREVVSGELGTTFASWYLSIEMTTKILFSVGLDIGLSSACISCAYSVLSIVACVGLVFVKNVELEVDENANMLAKTLDTARLWSDIRTWLLSPTNITFGMSSAFIQGYFAANFAAPQLGEASIGYATSFIVLVAVVVARLYGCLRNKYGTGLPLSLGAASFALIPILILTTGCSHWGLWLLIVYALQGSGRASYENTNKVLFADTFPDADTQPAFANCILQFSAASALQYFMSAVLTGPTLEVIVLVFAILIPVAYFTNYLLFIGADAEKQPLIAARKQLV